MATNSQHALDTKTKLLYITVKRTTNILDKGDEESIECHLATLRTIISDVEKLRFAVEVVGKRYKGAVVNYTRESAGRKHGNSKQKFITPHKFAILDLQHAIS